MVKHVLFVHGGGGGAYEADSKLATNLQANLGQDYVVHYPKMPDEEDPSYAVWKRRILEELEITGDHALLVGHSIGASVLIKFLVDGALTRPLSGVFLISTPYWHDHEVWRWNEVSLPRNAADLLPNDVPLFLYHSRQDEVVPFTHLEMYTEMFPQATVRALDGRDHQMNDDLTEVVEDIKHLR